MADKLNRSRATREAARDATRARNADTNRKRTRGIVHPNLILSRKGNHFVPKSAACILEIASDGSCLFTALIVALLSRAGGRDRAQEALNADHLRQTLINWLEANPEALISDLPMRDWVNFDSGLTVASYCKKMRGRGAEWGGGIELAIYALLFGVAVHLYERVAGGGFRCISCFDTPAAPTSGGGRTTSLVYSGRHYEVLVIDQVARPPAAAAAGPAAAAAVPAPTPPPTAAGPSET